MVLTDERDKKRRRRGGGGGGGEIEGDPLTVNLYL